MLTYGQTVPEKTKTLKFKLTDRHQVMTKALRALGQMSQKFEILELSHYSSLIVQKGHAKLIPLFAHHISRK